MNYTKTVSIKLSLILVRPPATRENPIQSLPKTEYFNGLLYYAGTHNYFRYVNYSLAVVYINISFDFDVVFTRQSKLPARRTDGGRKSHPTN